MRVALRPFVIAALAAMLGLTGCETKKVWIEVPSFGTGDVDGIWLWRLSSDTQQWERACRIAFSDAEQSASGERLTYWQECGDHAGWQLWGGIERSNVQAGTITVGLWYMRFEDPGTYKVSTYTDEGESELSETTVDL